MINKKNIPYHIGDVVYISKAIDYSRSLYQRYGSTLFINTYDIDISKPYIISNICIDEDQIYGLSSALYRIAEFPNGISHDWYYAEDLFPQYHFIDD